MERKRKASSYKMKKSALKRRNQFDMFSVMAPNNEDQLQNDRNAWIDEQMQNQSMEQMNQDASTMSQNAASTMSQNIVSSVGEQMPQQTNVIGNQRGRGLSNSPMSKRKKFIMKRNKK
tara:strand:- start:275 stop:628 length:354 start_codon:yes stop_codon:yes gene_type:complete